MDRPRSRRRRGERNLWCWCWGFKAPRGPRLLSRMSMDLRHRPYGFWDPCWTRRKKADWMHSNVDWSTSRLWITLIFNGWQVRWKRNPISTWEKLNDCHWWLWLWAFNGKYWDRSTWRPETGPQTDNINTSHKNWMIVPRWFFAYLQGNRWWGYSKTSGLFVIYLQQRHRSTPSNHWNTSESDPSAYWDNETWHQ